MILFISRSSYLVWGSLTPVAADFEKVATKNVVVVARLGLNRNHKKRVWGCDCKFSKF